MLRHGTKQLNTKTPKKKEFKSRAVMAIVKTFDSGPAHEIVPRCFLIDTCEDTCLRFANVTG